MKEIIQSDKNYEYLEKNLKIIRGTNLSVYKHTFDVDSKDKVSYIKLLVLDEMKTTEAVINSLLSAMK